MKRYHPQIPVIPALTCCLIITMLLAVSCSKEKIPAPSNLDKNYFVIEDNPNDPIDHAIYEFYRKTGIAAFYKDSIYKKQVSREDEVPARYTYIKLSLNYGLLGSSAIYSKSLSSRTNLQSLLQLIEEEVIPKLPTTKIIPSLLLLDSFSDHTIRDIQLSHGMTSIYGFNTVGIKVEEVAAMSNEERKMYAASLLAGFAAHKTGELYGPRLQKDFFSISRAAARSLVPIDIYSGYFWLMVVAPGTEPVPKDIGLLFYPTYDYPQLVFPCMPREADDLRAFLTAVFRYTTQEFADLHANETLILQKFNIIRNIVKEAGFKIPG